MTPSIGRCLGQGFRTANRSWAGMGFLMGCWIIVGVAAVGVVAVTGVPEEALVAPETKQAATPAPNINQPPTPTPSEPSPTPAAADSSKADIFQQMSTPPTTPAESEMTQQPPATQQAGRDETARRDQLIEAWIRRAWPMLLFCFLLVVAANIWLTGGQVGYLAQQTLGQPTGLSAFWRSGTKAFGRLLGGSLLGLLAFAAVGLLVVLLGLAFSALSKALPAWVLTSAGVIFAIVAIGSLVWLMVRLSFWFIAIVVDGAGPVAGFITSFRRTQGQWWRLAGLGALVLILSYAVWLPAGLLEWAGNLAGGGIATVAGLLGNLFGILASLYIGFAGLAAYIQFYQEIKPSA